MQAENLKDLFERGLEFVYDGEQQQLKTLPEMAEAASSAELKNALGQYLAHAHQRADRLEQIFFGMGRSATADTNDAVKSIFSEIEKQMKHIDHSALLDAAMIANQNQVLHYKIALYGSLRSFACTLGLYEFAGLLERSLCEEEAVDRILSHMAENRINREAGKCHNSQHGFAMI
jgi:ferritin-like metal-binding protein YciE